MGDKTAELLSIKYPEKNYVVLENFNESRESSLMHIIDFGTTNTVNIGRARNSDIRINDISVSRKHASLKMTKNGVYMVDLDSKFGTLMQIRREIVLETGRKVTVQCGRSVLTFLYKRPWSWTSCFILCGK
jgi:hypothetical protein